ncbi:MAG: hypothetical protein V7785_22975 [Bermanella sp.]
MVVSEHLIEYDNLSIKLLSALANNALGNISSSAGKMLDVACLFFDKDLSEALLNFHKLYLENSQLDAQKDDINQQADAIFEAAQSSASAQVDVNFTDSSQQKINELANVQKELEALIQQDAHIKERMVPVMQCMQYEDLISNRIQRLIQCWEYMVSLLNSKTIVNVSEALTTFDDFLSSEDEHHRFFEWVLKTPYVQQDLEEVNHDIEDINTLQERLFEFSQASLNDCVEQTQQAFDELLILLNLVTGESDDVAYLFTDKAETLSDIKAILSKSQTLNNQQASNMIGEIASARSKHSEEASELIQSFMVALQSQDIIRQNIENIGHFHHCWSACRDSMKKNERVDEGGLLNFGQELVSKMTSLPEKVIIEQFIPGVDVSDEGDDGVFF